jgi:hypothetical protein
MVDLILRVLLILSAPFFIYFFSWGGICLSVLVYLFFNLIKNTLSKIGG